MDETNLRLSYSLKNNVMEKLINEMKDVFKDIEKDFSTTDISFDVHVQSGYTKTIRLTIKEDKLHWADKVIDISFEFDKQTGEVESSFNYGSGGWREEYSSTEILTMFNSCISASINAISIAEKNSKSLVTLINKFNKVNIESSAISGELHRIKLNSEKEIRSEKEINFMKELGWKKVTDAEEIMDLLQPITTFGYNSVRVSSVYCSLTRDGEDRFRMGDTRITLERGVKSVYKVDNSRISLKNLLNMDFSDMYFVPENQNMFRVMHRVHNSVQEIKDIMSGDKE